MRTRLKNLRPRTPKQWGLALLVVVIAGYTAWCGLLFVVQDRLIFRRSHPDARPAWPAETELSRTLTLDIGGGQRVYARLLLPQPTAQPTQHPAAIVLHGNWAAAAEAEKSADVKDLLARGWVVLVPEYRGYSPSQGLPSQEMIAQDMREFRRVLATRADVDPARIVYLARSLGAGIACELARTDPPAAMILVTPFATMSEMAHAWLAPGWLVRHPFDNLSALASLDAPVLIVHGTNDRNIPVEHARRLAAAARNATLLIDDGTHNSTPTDAGRYREEVGKVLGRVERR